MGGDRRVLAGGRAVLYCGDSLELLRQGAFDRISAIVTDPPYGIGYQHSGATPPSLLKTAKKVQPSRTDTIHGDDKPFDPAPWLAAAPPYLSGSDAGRRILLWGADKYMQRLPEGGTLLAWDKHIGRGSDDSFADCEWAWVWRPVKREVFRWMWKGVLTQKSTLDVATSALETERTSGSVFARVHVSQKPVELMRWCIDKVRPSDPELPILDPYMGSCSTGVAALSLGYRFIGCEIDPQHFEVACARIERAWAFMGGEGLFEEAIPL